MIKKCVFLSAGHGGVDPSTNRYTTAPSKMFKHKNGQPYHDGAGTFYEGVKNRKYADRVAALLTAKGVNVVKLYHPWLDTPLNTRTELANWYHKNVQQGIYFSEHSNATESHTARGYSVWTSPGQTASDGLATDLMDRYDAVFGEVSEFRRLKDTSDGDPDYEARFSELVNTAMPAILSETLFFDHPNDANVLMSDSYFNVYTQMVAEWLYYSVQR